MGAQHEPGRCPEGPRGSPGSPGSPAKQWGRGSTDESPARDTRVAEAARAADLHPETLVALLSDDDRADLDAGLLTSDELAAYARSVSARWARGYVLADEAELVTAERMRRDPLDGLPLMREDRMFVARCTVGRADQHGLLTEYRARWLAAAEAEGNEIRRDNAGRRAANAWLREIRTEQGAGSHGEPT